MLLPGRTVVRAFVPVILAAALVAAPDMSAAQRYQGSHGQAGGGHSGSGTGGHEDDPHSSGGGEEGSGHSGASGHDDADGCGGGGGCEDESGEHEDGHEPGGPPDHAGPRGGRESGHGTGRGGVSLQDVFRSLDEEQPGSRGFGRVNGGTNWHENNSSDNGGDSERPESADHR